MRKLSAGIFLVSGTLLILLSIISLWDAQLPVIFYILVIFLGVISFYHGYRQFQGSGPIRKRAVIMSVILLLYILGETTINILVFTKAVPDKIPGIDLGFGVFNEPCASYDPVRGYRWDDGKWRISKILNKTIIYDQWFEPNPQGIYFNIDYSKLKADSTVRRYIVFGDSFTAGEFLASPWPQYFNELAVRNDLPVELYSFALNGGGLANWHSTFFKEIVSNYEFDGIIMAVFADDLKRSFFVMEHTPETGFTGYLDSIPESAGDLLNNYADQLDNYATYMPDSLIDQFRSEAMQSMDAKYNSKPGLYFLSVLISLPTMYMNKRSFRKFLKSYLIQPGEQISIEDAKAAMGDANYSKLAEMIKWCKVNDKHVILTSLPYQPVIPYLREGKELTLEAQLRAVGDHYSLDYFNGLQPYTVLDDDSLSACFLLFDIHWNQNGSDYFTEVFFEYFRNNYSENVKH